MSDATQKLSTCGCCEDSSDAAEHENRPGQPALVYRIGTHSAFLQRMKMRLSTQEIVTEDGTTSTHPLSGLTTRSTEDPAIALLDAWAMVSDVLTFYQERIANEGYLRTATGRRSVLDLARAIGYELSPGVAASTYLAFTVDDKEGSPKIATIKVGTKVMSIPSSQDELPQTFETVGDDFEAKAEWNSLKPVTSIPQTIASGTTKLYLAGVHTNLQPGDGILLVGDKRDKFPGSEVWDFRLIDSITTFPEDDYTLVTWETGLGHDHPTVYPADNPRVYAFRQRAKLFGCNAPDWKAMSSDIKKAYDPPNGTASQWPNFKNQTSGEKIIDLDTTYPKIRPDGWIVLVKPSYVELYKVVKAITDSRTDFTLTAQVTRLELDAIEHLSWFDLRDTVVYAQSEQLEQAEVPVTTPVTGTKIDLDGCVDGLTKGQTLIVSGKLDEDDEDTISEVVTLDSATVGEDTTAIVLQGDGLANSYAPSTVAINANVVAATHGETVSGEVLGNGSGTQTNQQFTLKKSPLTYVSATTASGAESTLELRVNGVLWEEASSLYGKEATDHIYVVRIDDDAKATVTFGDGKSGTRLPTGQENIKATYRAGIGEDGEVGAGKLTLLKSRPFGVRGVTNPLAASGAADPEVLDDARTNAPLTVLTLDRIVSLQDFEDFSRAFKGLGKAQAVNLWNGESYLVHITIADDSGQTVDESSATYTNLVDAIDAARDPTAEVRIDSIDALTFDVKATVLYDAAYVSDDVKASIEAALADAFCFDKREFAQPVTPAEIISVIHQVEGVVAVDLDTPSAVLAAEIARWKGGEILPAQLLTINTSGINLTMSVAP